MVKRTRKKVKRTVEGIGPARTEVVRIPSPASTGQAGSLFEQHVDAYWLAQLLVRGIPPILVDCAVVEVHLQTNHLGWNTDDFLIVGENGSGEHRKLAGQVKRTFSVSASDEECKRAIQDFWKDFRDPQRFRVETDRFALVTLRGTNSLLEHFSGLLDCARAARDQLEFEHRLATPGFINAKSRRYCEDIQTIVGETEGTGVSPADVWPFLRVLHILSLDLNTATRQTEAMIQTLLAQTTGGQDAIGTANASWNELLRILGDGMPAALSYRITDLPQILQQRHSVLGGLEHQVLRALREHSAVILGGIRSTIGSSLHLGRRPLVQQVLTQLESSQVVLLTGDAGAGKSAIAKDALGILSANHFAFTFRAEEFACAHLDGTLHASQIPASADRLGGILAGQDRKILLIESVERLLERSTRDSFTDLLTLVANDTSWRLILTCRGYSAGLVRDCFLEARKVKHSVVSIPPLDDEELSEVESAHPNLAVGLANAALRGILRNPYILDKALQIEWSEGGSMPQSEGEFRALFWREIVRVENRPADGMPRRRGDAFMHVALRRARALTQYAVCDDLDLGAVEGLRSDSLIVSAPLSDLLMAPAHDVLEDWAILQWLEEQHAKHKGSIHKLAAEIGVHPAVRRTFRKWAAELVLRDPGSADNLFQAAMCEGELPAQFRDDSLLSLLGSPSSPDLLEKHSQALFANDKQLLRRVIHLLRVGCVAKPPWLGSDVVRASLFNVPDGPAWPCVLRLVQIHLESFTKQDCPLLLGFIEDWARGVHWQCPYPEGNESAAAIAHWLLPQVSAYGSDNQRRRTLKVIAKIPNADRARFAAILKGRPAEQWRDPIADEFRQLVLESLEGFPAARDIPELIVSTMNEHLLCSEADRRPEWGYGNSLELEPIVFGIKEGGHLDYFPASAYRSPLLSLLRFHPNDGLEFFISVFNHSAEWYAHPRVRSEFEAPFEITLTFAHGTPQKQWCNSRLWNLYRGTSVGPYVLQSFLMGLERWLLEFAEARPDELDAVLVSILRRSQNAALTAVVASVATAFPHTSGEALLILLTSRYCVQLDKWRLTQERTAGAGQLIPQLDAQSRIYDEERNEANARPHRHRDLEVAILSLQLGAFAPRVHELLDRHRAELPPANEQSEEHRIWRLAIHRMDLRKYSESPDAVEVDSPPSEGQTFGEKSRRSIRLSAPVTEPDLKEIVDRSAEQLQVTNANLGLLMWGMKVFSHEEPLTYDPAQWRHRLLEAQTSAERSIRGEEDDLGRGGPGFVAAVCTRDHWEELSADERNWCLTVVCSEVERNGDQWDHFSRVQRGGMSADRPCAWIVPLLLGKSLAPTELSRVRKAFVVALTHAINEVRWYAAMGIGANLWGIDRILALRCTNALAMEGMLVDDATEAAMLRYSSSHSAPPPDDIEARTASEIRERFFEADYIPTVACERLDTNRWFGSEANRYILGIFVQAPTEPAAIGAFERVARSLVGWWDENGGQRNTQNKRRNERNHQIESTLSDLLYTFLLRTTAASATTIFQPILAAVDHHPREIHWVIRGVNRR